MLRLAIWYESSLGRNDGNPLYVCAFFKRVQFFCELIKNGRASDKLRAYFCGQSCDDKYANEFAQWVMDECGGLEIEHLRPDGKDIHTFGEFDYNIWVDWGEDGLTGILPYAPIIPDKNLLYWASDTHLGYDYRLSRARKADIVFAAQHDAVQSFRESGINAIWLPHCVDPLAYPRYNLASTKTDVCFVGHVNSDNRVDFLDRMFKEFPNFFYGQRLFEQASRKYAESKICLNIAMKNDVNMRCFEVMGAGGFLLTDVTQSMDMLFEDKKHCALYTTLDEAVEKARYYITNNQERKEIAKAGYNEVISYHKISDRCKVMIEQILNKKDMHSVKSKGEEYAKI